MRPTDLRRLVILAEGEFAPHSAKTAYGVIRYGRDGVVAVLDSTKAGQNVQAYLPGHDIPIVATLGEALALPNPPDALLIGIAPTGGRLPDAWRAVILEAIAAGLDVLSGLHTFLGDDPEFGAAAAARGTTIVDYRRPPDRMETAVRRQGLVRGDGADRDDDRGLGGRRRPTDQRLRAGHGRVAGRGGRRTGGLG